MEVYFGALMEQYLLYAITLPLDTAEVLVLATNPRPLSHKSNVSTATLLSHSACQE